jgi:hypothetical protein
LRFDQTGLYTAPSSVPEAITVGVQAASTANAAAVAETSFTVSPSSSGQQMVGPVTPNGGTGNKQLFSFQATPVSGSLAWVQMLFGESLSPTSACLVYYDPPSQTIRLSANDSTASYNDWVNQPVVLGTPSTVIANSQCSVDVGNSSVTGSSSTGLHVNLSVTFLGPWQGSLQYIFMAAEDSAGNQTDWPIVGTWNIP